MLTQARASHAEDAANASIARVTSSSVVSSPSDTRTALRARASPSIAVTTGDGSLVPALHALPLETLTPSRSSAATSSAPRQPSNEMFVTCGARAASAARSRAVHAGGGGEREERALERVTPRGERGVACGRALRVPRRHREPRRRDRVHRPRAQPSLLRAAEEHRRRGAAPAA